MQTSPPRIFLGRVIGAHGIRGELKVRAETDSAEILLQIGEVEIDGRHYQVTGVRPHKQHLLLSLAGIRTSEGTRSVCRPYRRVNITGMRFWDWTFIGLIPEPG
ncbi:MAG: hypothetical protein JRI66_01715 [Deltaproteobacteria bacterium]|nr:hypothetical protein [Deltaproteobacteria bacterium]